MENEKSKADQCHEAIEKVLKEYGCKIMVKYETHLVLNNQMLLAKPTIVEVKKKEES